MNKEIERLIFVTPFRYPSRMAHSLHGMAMAKAFKGYFGENFLFILNGADDKNLLFGINYFRFAGPFGNLVKIFGLRKYFIPMSLMFFLITHHQWRNKKTVVFANDPVLFGQIAFLKKFFKFKTIFESHGFFTEKQSLVMVKYADKIVFVTKHLRDGYLERYPKINDKSIVVPNAVDVSAFDKVGDDKNLLREQIGFPKDKKIIGYVGRFLPLGQDKGLELMIDSLLELPQEFICAFIGGTEDEIERYSGYSRSKNIEERVIFIPHVNQIMVPVYMKACDILAYVPSTGNTFFDKETSPMKLFEYMASKVPIIVSDTPAIREILNHDSAFIIKLPDSRYFADKIVSIFENKDEIDKKVYNAKAKVENNTWINRVKKILDQNEP